RGRPPAPKTVRNILGAMRAWYAFMERFDLIEKNPMRQIDDPVCVRRTNDWLRPDQDEAVLSAQMNEQERLLINLLRWTGIRVSEARALLWSDVSAEGIPVRQSKTIRGIRTSPLLPELAPHLRQREDSTLVMATRNGTPMVAQHMEKLTRRVGERAGVEKLTPHRLRRTFGSDLLNRGVRLEVVSRLLGHSSTKVTEESYAELLDVRIREEVMAAVA